VPAKYLNSPETELFHKRQTLYNGQTARQAAHDGKPVIVVEGYLDVVAAVAAGFEGTVAPLGTALTEEHVQLLWRMSDAPILCFDGDGAGQRAAERSAEVVLPLLKPGKTVRIATLPEGLDPDDLIKKHGRDAFSDVIDRALALSEVVWNMETRGLVPETPEARAALEARIRERSNSIGDASVKRHYAQAFDEKLQAFFAPARANRFEGRRNDGGGGRPAYGQSKFAPKTGRGSPRVVVSPSLLNSRMMKPGLVADATAREAVIILSLINHPPLVENRLEGLASLEFDTPNAQAVMTALLDIVTHDHDITGEGLTAALGGRGFGEAIERMRSLMARQGVWQIAAEIDQIDVETGLKHALSLHNKKVQLNKELKAAEVALGDDPSDETFERLRDIQSQITTVDGTEALIEGFGSLSGRATRSF
jgi:DNA primase